MAKSNSVSLTRGSWSRASLPVIALLVIALVGPACAGKLSIESPVTPELVEVPSGLFVFGSDSDEREYAYQLDEQAYGHSVTRTSGWYDNEPEPQSIHLDTFRISKHPITNRQYAQFVEDTDHRSPDIDAATWQSYGLVHPFTRTDRHRWRGQAYPPERALHPVVLVSYNDAEAYAAWLSAKTGSLWRLPTEQEWVKAARGSDGRRFPWGNRFDRKQLNSHDAGPFDTVPVGSHSTPGPFGMMDSAGQVFEWISAPPTANRSWVKGGSWDDKGCGVCRPSARHSRPKALKHILIGFRLVKE